MNKTYNPHTLFVTDLDGTLLNKEAEVSPESARLINQAIYNGAKFTIATARTPATVAGIIKDLKIFLPTIVLTGATLWDSRTNKYNETKYIYPEAVEKTIEIYREIDFSAFIFTLSNNHIDIYHIGRMSDEELNFMNERKNSPYKTFHIDSVNSSTHLPPIEDYDKVILFYAIQPGVETREAYERVKKSVECTPLYYHDIYGSKSAVTEVFAHHSSKASAIKSVAQKNGIERIVAFGDNINDIPMLRLADIAVCPENAVDEVKEIADIIIGDNGSDSVAKFIASNPDL